MTAPVARWTPAEALLAWVFRSAVCRVLGFRALRLCFGFELRGEENVPRGKAVVFAGNHSSYYDALFSGAMAWLLQGRDPSVVAFSRAADFPFLRGIIRTRSADLILADPRAPVLLGQATVLAAMIDRLEAGRSLVVFAEGQRRDTLGAFLPGAAAAAQASGAPIVPFTLLGVHSLWKEHTWPDHWTGRVRVQIHEPVRPEDYRDLPRAEAIAAMTAELRRRVASAIDYPDALAARGSLARTPA